MCWTGTIIWSSDLVVHNIGSRIFHIIPLFHTPGNPKLPLKAPVTQTFCMYLWYLYSTYWYSLHVQLPQVWQIPEYDLLVRKIGCKGISIQRQLVQWRGAWQAKNVIKTEQKIESKKNVNCLKLARKMCYRGYLLERPSQWWWRHLTLIEALDF